MLTGFLSLHSYFFYPSRFLEFISSDTSGRDSHGNRGGRASTLPRTKSKTHTSAKPNICISAPKPDSHPTISILKLKQSDSPHLHASQWSDFHPLLHQPEPEPKLRVSPTLTVPTPRLSPTPTALGRGGSPDDRGGRQPSPVARERRARSISISNFRTEPSSEVKHEVLDQEALMDFTHSGLRRVRPVASRENRHQTEPYRLPSKTGASESEKDVTARPEPNPKIKQQQERQPDEAAKWANIVRRDPQSGSDGLSAHSGLQRRSRDSAKKSSSGQTSDHPYSSQQYERAYSGKRAAPPHLGPVSADGETSRGQFASLGRTRWDETPPPHWRPAGENHSQTFRGNASEFFPAAPPQSTKSALKSRLPSQARSHPAQTDLESAAIQPDCSSKDSRCQSRGIDRTAEASQSARGLNRPKTCLVAPRTLEAPDLPPADSHSGPLSKPDLRPFSQESPGQRKSHNVSRAGLDQICFLEPPSCYEARTELPERSRPPSLASGPFVANKTHQRPGGRAATASPQTPKRTRAFVTEDSGDPDYVTMFCPGSVYVGE